MSDWLDTVRQLHAAEDRLDEARALIGYIRSYLVDQCDWDDLPECDPDTDEAKWVVESGEFLSNAVSGEGASL